MAFTPWGSDPLTRIILIRHAKAEAPQLGLDDHDRPLTMQGRTAAAQLAEALVAAGVTIDVALVSSAVRAQQTWKRMADAFDGTESRVVESLYETHIGGVLAELTALEDLGCVAIVGHEPTISATASWLAGPGSNTKALQRVGNGMPTASAALLDFEGPWAELDHTGAVLTAICAADALY